VIVQKCGEGALVLADTKVTNRNAVQSNEIPGRLKIIVLDTNTTVAFAGDADPAILAIKELQILTQSSGPEAASDVLKKWSISHDIDFILVQHLPLLEISVIRHGGSVAVSDIAHIGDDTIFKRIIQRARDNKIACEDAARSGLRPDFMYVLSQPSSVLTGDLNRASVGGFAIAVSAKHNDHRYLPHASVTIVKFPELANGEAHEPNEWVQTGEGRFQYKVIVANEIGIPKVGVCIPQAEVGYIYSPMRQGHNPIKILLADKAFNWMNNESQLYDKFKCNLDLFES
jgi:hypothetical protein